MAALPPVSYLVVRDPSTDQWKLSGSGERPPAGLYGYHWTVIDENGARHTLSGITENLSKRLSSYIAEINRPSEEDSSDLNRLASAPNSSVQLELFGPYGDDQDPKELEQQLIASVKKEESLNRTSGGNGGGSWAQYGDPTPSVSDFPKETPDKRYRFQKEEGGPIVVKFTPGIKKKLKRGGGGGVYVIRRDGDDRSQCYVGQSTDVVSRARVHASKATYKPKTKIQRALAKSPNKYSIGVLEKTLDLTPRSRRAAEKHHIEQKRPAYNSDSGGGGPAPMRKRRRTARSLILSSSQEHVPDLSSEAIRARLRSERTLSGPLED